MNDHLALALDLFDVYSDMSDEAQAAALAALRTIDPRVHDALVQLLVTDALGHALDVPPWIACCSLREAIRDEGGSGIPDTPRVHSAVKQD